MSRQVRKAEKYVLSNITAKQDLRCLGAAILMMQEYSKEISCKSRRGCTILINFMIFIIMNKDMISILPERTNGVTFFRVLCNACTFPFILKENACPDTKLATHFC